MGIVLVVGVALVLVAAVCACLAFRERSRGRSMRATREGVYHWCSVVAGVPGAALVLVVALAH